MKVPYGKQSITEEDINAVINVLKSDFLTQGPTVLKFEEEFAKEVGAKYAVSFCNATAALHSGFKLLNKNSAKKVLVSSITFAASSNCVLYEGGNVEFVDIDPISFNLDLNIIEDKLRANPDDYQGIIPVDFAGLPVDTEKLRIIADKYNLWIMEDACHAVGGGFLNSKNEYIACGSGKYSDLTIFSFHPVKHIATGEGGMVTTNNQENYQKLLKIRSHGIERNENLFQNISHGGWYHEMQELGFNYRMSDINAALGLSQLSTLKNNVEKRNAIAESYKKHFTSSSNRYQEFNANFKNAYHLFVIQTDKRKELYDYLKKNEIYTQVHYIPVHKHPYYQKIGFKNLVLPNAERFYDRALSLPMFHGLNEDELNYVLEKLESF